MPISTHIMRCWRRGKVPIWALSEAALESGKFQNGSLCHNSPLQPIFHLTGMQPKRQLASRALISETTRKTNALIFFFIVIYFNEILPSLSLAGIFYSSAE